MDIVTFAWLKNNSEGTWEEKHSWWEPDIDLFNKYITRLANGIDRTFTRTHRKILFTSFPDKITDDRWDLIKFDPKFKRVTNKFICYDPKYDVDDKIILTDLDIVFIENWDYLLENDCNIIMNNTHGTSRLDTPFPGGGFIYVRDRTSLFDKITKPLYELTQQTYDISTLRERIWFDHQIGARNIKYWQKEFPGSVVSYKKDWNEGRRGKICWHHGHPRPHECPDDYKKKYWI